MKRLGLAALVAIAPSLAAAQQETLLPDSVRYGAFGGPVLKLTQVAGKDALLIGGRGAFLVNGTFALGGGGTAFSDRTVHGSDGAVYQLDAQFGGVELGYIHRTRKLVHFTTGVTIGGGGATQIPSATAAGGRQDDSFVFVEPALGTELNVSRGFRLELGVTYRYVSGVELSAFSDEDLRGVSVFLTFKFGRFL